VGLFVAGAAMVAAAIPIATTDLATWLGLGTYEARETAGVLAGLGLPAVFVGIFAVLPASRVVRSIGAIGAALATVGVSLFVHAYPEGWLPASPLLTALTLVVYSLGTLVTFWCLFVGIATFKRRTDPGGSAHLDVTEEGTVRVVSDDTGDHFTGVGVVGVADDPDATHTDGGTGTGAEGREPASDGGVADPAREPAAAAAAARRGRPDAYCGNCEHFQYVRIDGELRPYCGLYGVDMDDMDACEEWTPNG
jgi:hypothetical protein